MDNYQVTILESWKLSHRNEILADIQHSLDGLLPGIILKSKESGLSWKVISRTIFSQAVGQKRFDGEKEVFEHIKFMEPFEENFNRFRSMIAEKESKGIHQYSIEPIGHQSKPRHGEILDVENNDAIRCNYH